MMSTRSTSPELAEVTVDGIAQPTESYQDQIQHQEVAGGSVGSLGGELCRATTSKDIDEQPQSSGCTSKQAQPDCAGAHAESLDTVVDRLFRKQRNELMFELRRLQHGDRPVTGQGHREAVQHFFDRQLHADSAQSSDQAEQRPESVVVEVNALVERRPVSSILQSHQFRRSLETALRGALGSIRPRRSVVPPSGNLAQRSPPQQDLRTEVLRAQIESHSTPSSTVSDLAQEHATTAHAAVYSQREQPPAPAVLPSDLSQQPSSSRAAAWLQGQPVHVNPREEQERTVWETIEQGQRENIITDISELVQRQLVTSALDGHFRGRLEAHIRDRVVASGTNGQRVQQFVRSLPQNGLHQHNDFSHLGIVDPQNQANTAASDEVSVISATAAVAVPYAQSNTALTNELKALKAQMKEMQSMLRLSLDMQLDTQRAIRQEVAAALSQHGTSEAASQPQHQPRAVSDTQCLICLDNGADAVLYQCGHMCVCYTCGLNLRSRGTHCPMCRAPIKDIIRVYRSSLE